jgi:hypothetical protein
MMKRTVLAALCVAVAGLIRPGPADAQIFPDYRFDIGITAGGSAQLNSWENDIRFEPGWLVGGQATWWLSPEFGIRAHYSFTDRHLTARSTLRVVGHQGGQEPSCTRPAGGARGLRHHGAADRSPNRRAAGRGHSTTFSENSLILPKASCTQDTVFPMNSPVVLPVSDGLFHTVSPTNKAPNAMAICLG